MTDRRMFRGGPEAPTVASPVVATATVVIAVGVVAILQWSIQWTGDRNESLLLAVLNLYLATQAAWFFNVRWRSLDDPVDRRVRNVFLPIVVHFAARLALAALPIAPEVVQVADRVSWILTQLLAAVLLAYAFQGGSRRQRIIGTLRIAVVAVAVAFSFQWLERVGITEGVLA